MRPKKIWPRTALTDSLSSVTPGKAFYITLRGFPRGVSLGGYGDYRSAVVVDWMLAFPVFCTGTSMGRASMLIPIISSMPAVGGRRMHVNDSICNTGRSYESGTIKITEDINKVDG
jgi:hypothetical protein